MNNKENFKSGFVSIVGRTNVGKSTIINSLLNEKLVIMSDKPQTTRNNIRCIYTDEEAQIIFVDTPGVHRAKNKLSGMMTDMVSGSLLNTDMVVYVVEDDMHIGKTDQIILAKLKDINKPVIVLINKADKLSQDEVLFKINLFKEFDFINDIIPISALKGKNMELIIPYIKKYLQQGPMYFPQDMITDKPEKFFISELIREKALNFLQQEIPQDFGIGTGKLHTVQELCEIAYSHVGHDWKKNVRSSQELFRPVESTVSRCDSAKAKRLLGWEPLVSFEEMVIRMVETQIQKLSSF